MQERHEFDYENNSADDPDTDEKVRILWKDLDRRMFLRQRRTVLLGIWAKALTAAVSAATFIAMVIGGWKK